MALRDLITSIKGVGPKTAEAFELAGIRTVNDLLHYFPRNYISVPDISPIGDLSHDGRVVIKGTIRGGCSIFSNHGKTILSFEVADVSGSIRAYVFGMPYLRKNFYQGRKLILSGNVTHKGGKPMISQPKILSEDEYEKMRGTMIPVYPVGSRLTGNTVSKAVSAVIGDADEIREYLPEDIVEREGLSAISEAIKKMHFPTTMEDVYAARKRLAFDEFFLFLAKMKLLKKGPEKIKSSYVIQDNGEVEEKLLSRLPYELTGAQRRAVEDILRDMGSGFAANRLVQGDVGSGKTIVALAAAYLATKAGYQAVIMAPTEVLAAQHYKDALFMKEKYGLEWNPGLLSGSLKASEKKSCKTKISSGEIDLVIGTHALLEDDVIFNDLALVVTDEQHRFGVRQRMTIMEKGAVPHTVVMSATPIPRTLGLILYGDMDVSVIDEMPARRLEKKNAVVDNGYREKIYQMIVKHVRDGEQIYIICPMVESADAAEFGLDEGNEEDAGDSAESQALANVKDYTEKLRGILPADVRIDSLHGRMKPKEKNDVMAKFAAHETDVLVSTTVVEVGVNVPNATVMVVENAERFGLSQLHQLRGRVGRGDKQSYCIFVAGSGDKEIGKRTKERLEILKKTNDGFKIAEEDLKQRGPGDFFGLRQSGLPYFKIADIYTDAELLKRTGSILEQILAGSEDSLDRLKEALRVKENLSYVDFHGICL
ncbi:MAG: ATP-dependent DNA helicase RecG [Lachnospiraceae bacterium]|nr:ATP-dependent DNA helicase RecG [Lachnospiraceae bacterium]